MITDGWMLFTGMTLMCLVGLITRSWLVMVFTAMFAIPLTLNAQTDLMRIFWAGSGVIFTYIAFAFATSSRNRSGDDYKQ